MGWVDLNPSLKASIYTAPAASAAVFTANDLKEYLTPVDVSFSADFDAGGEVTQQDIAAIPQQIRFISGAGAPVTNNAWPKLSGNDDYKIATVRGATSNIAVGAESINGSISASILGIKDGNALLQSFRVYARATSGYELGFSIAPGVISKTSIQLYERQGTQSFNLTDRTDLSTFNSGAEEVSLTVNPNLLGEFPSVSLMNVAGFQAIHVKVKVENMTIMAWLQYRSGTDIKRYKLAASFNYANRPTGKPAGFLTKGRFGIVTDGDAQHFVDDISFQGEGYPTVSPLSWTIDRNVKSTDPVKRASVSNVGTTRTIRSTDLLTNAILNVSEVNPTQPSADQHQKVTLNLVGPVGSTTTTTVGIVKPQFAADLVRKTIIVRTSPDLKTGWLYMDGTLYETTTSTGVLHLESESQIQGAAAEAKQSFVLPADGVSEIVLRASQYSGSDVTSASDALAAAYDQIPVQTTGIPEPSYSLSSSGKSVAEKVLHYAAIRLISTASDSQDRIADLTHALIVSPVVSVGLVSAQNGLNYRIDSTYFAIPKSMTVDFPIGKIAYIPRNGDSSALANVVQQSRSLLTASELAARESELLSELTEQPTVSALTFLQFAELNNQPVMRIHKVGNLYVDDWATISNSTSDLLSWFPGATADFTNRIQQQVDDGGIITAFRSWWVINNIGRYGWLHESYVEKTGPNTFVPRITPIIESLLMERNSGNVYRGGVADDISNASGAALQSQSVATPDTNQGILRKADTDFTFSIPGFAVPFTRTWTSSRSDLSDVARVVSGGNLSDFGAGWTHPFAQPGDGGGGGDQGPSHRCQRNY